MNTVYTDRDKKHPGSTVTLWMVIACFSSLTLFSSAIAATKEEPKAPVTKTAETELKELAKTPEKPVYPETIAGAEQAFKDRKYQDSLKILLKLESDYAGKVRFDYLLGRCALATKQFDVASAAFTRVLTVDPNFAAARFELARTFYSKGVSVLARGPFEQARIEFAIVDKMNPPPELKKAIAKYQSNIDKYLYQRETQFDFYIETMGGYDSNIGTTPEADVFTYYDPYLPGYNTYEVDKSRESKESAIFQARTGVGIDWPLFSNDFEVFGALEFGGRSYSDNHGYDQTWDQVQLGARHYGDSNKKTLRFSFRKTDVLGNNGERERYHEQGELLLKLEVKNTQRNMIRFFILGGDSSYHAYGTNIFSVNYSRQGIESVNILAGKRKATMEVLLLHGNDYQQECNGAPYCPSAYERDLNGLRFGWGMNIFNTSRLYTSVYIENSTYHNQFFYQERRDQRRELFMGINTRMGDNWYFRPEIHYTRNESTIELFTHERWLATMTLGWKI